MTLKSISTLSVQFGWLKKTCEYRVREKTCKNEIDKREWVKRLLKLHFHVFSKGVTVVRDVSGCF